MKFLDYIFYRSYINLYKAKHKDYAESRSIAYVLLYPSIILFALLIIANKIFNIYDYSDHFISRRYLAIFIVPIVLLSWHFVEKRYKKFSKNSYEVLRNRFEKSKLNTIIPFWLIFIFPFVLLLGVPFVLSLF